jgi:ABC-type branched-subunit amino acid transport system permease subunit
LTELKFEGMRFQFNVWYRAVGAVSTALLVLSSISTGDRGLIVRNPYMLFAGALFAAVTAALFTVPYIRIETGFIEICSIIKTRRFKLSAIKGFDYTQGGGLKMKLESGAAYPIRMANINRRDRPLLMKALGKIAPMTGAEGGTDE